MGNTLHFEAGTLVPARGGQFQFHPKGSDKPEPVQKVEYKRGPGGGDHFSNFIAAVRSRKVEDLNADILEGHLSAALIHLANASYRLGEQVAFTPRTRAVTGNADATEALQRMEEHLAQDCKLKLEDWTLTVGRKLTVDPGSGTVVGDA